MNETTHYEGCWDSGPKHYECAVREVKMLRREWVGLTDDEVYKIAFALEGEHWRKIADAIEAKLREKNGG